jgi:5-hydroxyisourate hydrolase
MITTHVLDISRGVPAASVAVVLEVHRGSDWARLSTGRTDEWGRLVILDDTVPTGPGVYRLTFDTGSYHREHNVMPFFPEVQVVFTLRQAGDHIHMPLLLSPFSYSTYRGA